MRVQGVGVHNREVGRALEKCAAQGGVISLCGSGHYKVTPPDKTKPIVFMPSSPSDHRSITNIVSRLRRSGFKL